MSHELAQITEEDWRDLRDDVRAIRILLHGEDGALGIVAKVQIVWKSWIWLACTASALGGGMFWAVASTVLKGAL